MQPQNQQDPNRRAPQPHAMVVLQPGEQVICHIKRHPFGIISTYIGGLFAIGVAVGLGLLAPNIAESYNYQGDVNSMAIALVLLVSIAVGLALFIATYVYWQNQWIVTDDSVTQINQDGLFGKRTGQLSMGHLEDVTVDKSGLIQTMFNFGTLKVETAGERSKFVFPYCPDPDMYARKILEVREAFMYRHDNRELNPVMPIANEYSSGERPAYFTLPQSQQQAASKEHGENGAPQAPYDPNSRFEQYPQPPQAPYQPVSQMPQASQQYQDPAAQDSQSQSMPPRDDAFRNPPTYPQA